MFRAPVATLEAMVSVAVMLVLLATTTLPAVTPDPLTLTAATCGTTRRTSRHA